MIKKLNIKMLISMFILVMTLCITSSCFAAESVVLNYDDYISSNNLPSLSDVRSYLIDNGYDISNTKILAMPYYRGKINGVRYNGLHFWFVNCEEDIYLKYWWSSSSEDFYRHYTYFVNNIENDASNKFTNYSAIEYQYYYDYYKEGYCSVINEHKGTDTTNPTPTLSYSGSSITFFDINEFSVYDNSGNIIFDATKNYISATYEFQNDSSAKVSFSLNKELSNYTLKYSLTGVEPNVSLTEPVKLRNPIVYNIGTSNLVVKPNSKVYYALYDSSGKCLEQDVLIIPEYDTFKENSDKDITYNLEYAEDYSYATLSAQIINKDFSDKLMWSSIDMLNVSTGKLYGGQTYSNSLKITDNGNYYFYGVDVLDNVFVSKMVNVDKIVNFSESDFSYEYYNNSTLHGGYDLEYIPRIKTYSAQTYIEFKIELTSGNNLAYVNVRSDWAEKGYVDSAMGTLNGSSKSFTGKVYSGDIIHIYSASNDVEDLKGTITFVIKSKINDKVLLEKTYTIGVNGYTPGNIISGDSGSDTGSSSSSSSNGYGGDYPDVSWNDIKNQVSTNSSFWQMIKTIFSCLPIWLTGPILFFISGVITIVLTKLLFNAVTSMMK